MSDVLERLGRVGLVPVVKIDRAEDAVPLAEALLAGGLPCAEITFRTAAAPAAIKSIAGNCPDMLVGAGTDHQGQAAEGVQRLGRDDLPLPVDHREAGDGAQFLLRQECP